MKTLASSFADPADVVAWRKWRAIYLKRGHTVAQAERAALAHGDNGVGCWGDVTAQDHTPMCALPPQAMESKWGSVKDAKHKCVLVTLTGTGGRLTRKMVVCLLADKMPRQTNSSGAGIDLNPAASAALGLFPPHLAPVEWEWA